MKCEFCGKELEYIEVKYYAVYEIVDLVYPDFVHEEAEKTYIESFDERAYCPYCRAEIRLDFNTPIMELLRV